MDAATFAELAGIPEANARSWLAEQLEAALLHAVTAPDGESAELLLPGEYVAILLGDHGEAELDGARRLLEEHRDEIPHVLGGGGRPCPSARAV